MSKRGKSRGKAKGKLDDEKNSLSFKVLSADHTKELLDLAEVDDVQRKLGEILSLTDCATDLKCGAILDYYVSGFWWCKHQSCDLKVTSAFFSVMHQMLENLKEKHLSLSECLADFKALFAGVGMEHSDVSGGLGCMDLNQAKLVMDYFHTSFFQHYKMYEFLFQSTQAEEIIGTDLKVDVPPLAELPWPPPLEEAVPAELYNTYICTPPPTPKPEEKSDSAEGGGKMTEEQLAENERVADLLTQLTVEEVKQVMDSTFNEMLTGLKGEVEAKLRQKEFDFLNRINKVHRTPSASVKS